MSTLRRAFGWIGGLFMIVIFATAMLVIWPFVRQLKDEADDN